MDKVNVGGSNPSVILLFHSGRNTAESEVKTIKEISKQDIDLLIKRGIIHNTNHGYVDRHGNDIGFYRTKGVARKRYVKDKFVNMLGKL